MSNRKKSLKNLLYSTLGLIITIAFGLILPRLYITSFGSEVNGLLNSLNQVLVYLGLFEAGVGATTLQALYKPVARNSWEDISGVLSATNHYYKQTGKWYFLSLCAISIVYPIVIKTELSFSTVAGTIFFSGIGNVVTFYYQAKYKILLQAEGKSYVITNLTTIINIAVNLTKVLLIQSGYTIVSILVIAFLIQSVQAIYMVFYIRKNYTELSLHVKPNYKAIDQKNYMLIHQISGLVFQNTDVLILTIMCDLKVVSVYSMYKLVVSQLENVLSILTNSVNFILGQTFQIDIKKYIVRIDVFESYFSAFAFALFSVALNLYLPFMKLYTANVTDINYVDYNLAVLFIIIELLNVMRAPMLYTINYAGHFKQTVPQTIAESVINLVVSLIGVVYLGIYGVLLGTVIALLYRTNDIIIYSNKKILNRPPCVAAKFVCP